MWGAGQPWTAAAKLPLGCSPLAAACLGGGSRLLTRARHRFFGAAAEGALRRLTRLNVRPARFGSKEQRLKSLLLGGAPSGTAHQGDLGEGDHGLGDRLAVAGLEQGDGHGAIKVELA